MFTLLRMLPIKRLALEQLPALAGAWLIAELFYKFHSFTLECGAFLLTWLALDGSLQFVISLVRGGGKASAPGSGHGTTVRDSGI